MELNTFVPLESQHGDVQDLEIWHYSAENGGNLSRGSCLNLEIAKAPSRILWCLNDDGWRMYSNETGDPVNILGKHVKQVIHDRTRDDSIVLIPNCQD